MSRRVLVLRSHTPIPGELADSLRELGLTALWEAEQIHWRAYFPEGHPDPSPLLSVRYPQITCTWEDDPSVDWAARYQASLRPMAVGRRFAILPSPDLCNPWPERIPLYLVPGMAFGTGEHYTTASCLRILDERAGAPQSVLDVGCGSGILSAAACKLGCTDVVACDVDPDALEVAGETAAANGVRYRLVQGSADCVEGRFHLVLANILAETLVALLPDLAARTAPGGQLIGSGIAFEKREVVLAAAAALGFRLAESRTDGGWWTLLWAAGQPPGRSQPR